MPRVTVPQKVFDALEYQRRRHGVMHFLKPDEVAKEIEALGLEEEAAWVVAHSEEVYQGAVSGFVSEDHIMPPENPRFKDDP